MKKKFLTLALAGVTALGLASCGTQGDATSSVSETTTPVATSSTVENATYTLHDYLGATTSLNWNPLSWETSDDSSVLSYLSMGFYDYQVNDTKDGYVVVPEMAESLPTDVTSQYVGSYGITTGETNKAFQIKLNKNAKWQDGTLIKADDYIYSMQQQLDSEQMNRRADSYYGGDFSIVNAKNYLYSGKEAFTTAMVSTDYGDDEYVDPANFTTNSDGDYLVNGLRMAVNLGSGGNWGDYGLTAYFNAEYLPEATYNVLKDNADSSGFVVMNATTLAALQDLIAVLHGYENAAAYAEAKGSYAYQEWEEMAFYGVTMDVTSWDDVGLFKLDDYTIVVVLEKELENPNFYLPYHLSSTWLVNKTLYEASWTTSADGTRVNKYNTTLENTISYGPYKLTYFEADKQLKFERNENWCGYSEDKHKGQYQTTNIVLDVISDHKTALLAFLQGNLSGIGMQSDDLDTYGNSKYLMYTPQSYTTKITFNTDAAALAERQAEGENKLLLTYKEFRQAFSLAIDRSKFTSEFTAAAAPGYGLFNYLYQYFDSEGGTTSYRNTDAAKKALVDLYELEYGDGKTYETLDEAYEAMTGYDMAKAKKLMQAAYDKAVADGVYNGTDKVKLRFSMYQSDDLYKNMFTYFDTQLKEACKGTSLEGKVELEFYVDDDYYNSMYAGKTDIIFSTWGGATYGIFGMMSNVYVDDYSGDGNQMEVGFDTSKVSVTINVNGTDYTFSLKQWADWLNAKDATVEATLGAAAQVDPDERAEILAKLENVYLSYFIACPLYYRQTASLVSAQINYAAAEYIDLVGHGGISQITYNYTDAEWAKYVSENGNDLSNVYAG